jgi:hypothetical protein
MNLTFLKDPPTRKLVIAMACYLILALIGGVLLDGMLQAALLCFLAILAIKTLIHSRKDDEMS